MISPQKSFCLSIKIIDLKESEINQFVLIEKLLFESF
jgi:hypothetical protein